MKANTVFPVTAGTVVKVSCESGYGLAAGDTSVTCIKNTEFNYNVEPECGQLINCSFLSNNNVEDFDFLNIFLIVREIQS